MSKKKKKNGKNLETDYVIFLMVDGTKENSGIIKMVHRSQINEYYAENWSDIEVILIPMDDGLQYAILRDLPKPFKEFNISFDLYVTSFHNTHIYDFEDIEPIYYKIKEFDIRCKDIIDYVRFILVFDLLTSLPDELSSQDDFLSSVELLVERASYEYIKPNGKVIKDRVRKNDGTIPTSLDAFNFITGLSRVISKKTKKTASQFGFSCGLDDSDAIIINKDYLTWTILPEFGAYGYDYMDMLYRDNMLLGVYSDITNTCVFESPDKIQMFSEYNYFNVTIATFVCNDISIECVTGEHNSLFQHLMDVHGYDYTKDIISMKELMSGSLSDYVENYTVGYLSNNHDYNDILLLLVNAPTIAQISNIIHSYISTGIFTMVQFDHEMSKESGSIHCFLCEDIDMMSIYKDSFYDRFMDQLTVLYGYDLDDEEDEYGIILTRNDRAHTDPNDFPF